MGYALMVAKRRPRMPRRVKPTTEIPEIPKIIEEVAKLEEAAHRPDHSLTDWGQIIAKSRDITVVVAAMAAIATLFAYSRPVLDSGPMPFPARSEVTAVADTLQRIHADADASQMQLTSQLKNQSDVTSALSRQLSVAIADINTSRLQSLQPLLETAKENYTKEPTEANRRIMQVLEDQLNKLQAEIMKDTAR
jgi:hypothetical protein